MRVCSNGGLEALSSCFCCAAASGGEASCACGWPAAELGAHAMAALFHGVGLCGCCPSAGKSPLLALPTAAGDPSPRGVDATRACEPALLALTTTAGRPVHGGWVLLSTALPFILAPFSTAGGAADPTCGELTAWTLLSSCKVAGPCCRSVCLTCEPVAWQHHVGEGLDVAHVWGDGAREGVVGQVQSDKVAAVGQAGRNGTCR